MFLTHITIHTLKKDETIGFYEKYVGLQKIKEFGNITFLGNGKDETYIELIQDEGIQYDGKGLAIGFVAEDLDKKRAELIDAGLEPTDFISPNPRARFFFVKDPSGVMVQFINGR